MKKNYFSNILLTSLLAVAGLFSIAGVVVDNAIREERVAEKAKADGDAYSIAGSMNSWSATYTTYDLNDDDNDGIYTLDINLSAGAEFKIVKNHSWSTEYGRGCVAYYPTDCFWGCGSTEGSSNIHAVTAGNYTLTFTPSLSKLCITMSGTAYTFKTLYLVAPSDWSDWVSSGIRAHWWGSASGLTSNYYAAATMEEDGTYYVNSDTGTLYKTEIPADVTGVQALKASYVGDQTTGLTVSGTDDVWGYLAYNNVVYIQTFTHIPNGGYIRGVYHGCEPTWDVNIELTSDIVDEYVSYDYDTNQFHATLELYAGDYFKFVQIYNGVEYWRTIYSAVSADNTYYPIGWEGNNVKVENAGVYYITAGRGDGEHDGQEWYYIDNSASAFAYEFLNSMTCDATGASEPSWETGYSWKYFSDWYKYNLDSYAKDTFYSATSDEAGTNIEHAVARYLVLVASHGYDPFMTDSENSIRSISRIGIMNIEITDNTVVIVVSSCVALISIASLSVFVLSKKRKEF